MTPDYRSRRAVGTGVSNFVLLPTEVWRNRIISQLSLVDLCRLDSAVLSSSLRQSLLDAFKNAHIESEVILSTDIMDWAICKAIKPLRIKLIADVSTKDLFRFIAYCPQLQSLNTWDFDDDSQSVLAKSRAHDDSDATYARRVVDGETVIKIIVACRHLKVLRLCETAPLDWFGSDYARVAPFGVHLDELYYHETGSLGHQKYLQYSTFQLTPTTFKVDTFEEVPIDVLTLVALHYPALTSIYIHADLSNYPDEQGLFQIARSCPRLEKAILQVNLSEVDFIELCRLLPALVELRIMIGDDGVDYHHWTLQQALKLLPGLKVFSCECRDREAYFAVADELKELQVLGVTSTSVMDAEDWDYMLSRCPSLRVIQSAAGQGTAEIRSLARTYGVRIEQAPLNEFCRPW